MSFRILWIFPLILTLGALPGCVSNHARVMATQPDGGISRDLDHSYDVVFPATVRVMHENGETLGEAVQRTGRIVTLGPFETKGVFLKRLADSQTRVELSASMSSVETSFFRGGPEAFFSQLQEQIAVYEKKKTEKERLKKIQVDPDLRRTNRPQTPYTPVLVCPECAPAVPAVPYGRTVIKQRGLP